MQLPSVETLRNVMPGALDWVRADARPALAHEVHDRKCQPVGDVLAEALDPSDPDFDAVMPGEMTFRLKLHHTRSS